MEIIPIVSGFGARVTDIDLTGPLSADDIARLMLAWRQYHLLVLPGQQGLTESQQLAFCRYFGPIMANTSNTEVTVVSNVQSGFTHEGRLSWHMDLAFTPAPIEAICLFALVLPKTPSSTFFASNHGALKNLSRDLREQIDNLSVRNSFDMSINQHVVRYREPALGDEWPHVEVPLLQKHPLTGELGLMCCEMFSDPIIGLSKVDSDAMLERLYKVLYADDNVLEVHWQPGQLVIWDNLALQHGRPRTPASEGERTLRRITVSERNGYDYFPELVKSNMPQFRGKT